MAQKKSDSLPLWCAAARSSTLFRFTSCRARGPSQVNDTSVLAMLPQSHEHLHQHKFLIVLCLRPNGAVVGFGANLHVSTKADEHHWTNWMHASQPFCRWTASCTATTSLVGDVQVGQRLLLDRHTHLLGLWVLARRRKSRSSSVRGQKISARV